MNQSQLINVSVKCIKDLDTKYHNFKTNENNLNATQINDNWWIIDSIGIDEKSFKTFFKENK